MTKILTTIALASALVLSTGAVASANTGLAFVHGTGNQTDALNDYWTASNVNAVKAGLPNSSLTIVVNCNFDKYMWDSAAAGCLADHLYPFITNNNIDDLVVQTHSNGGNVMRWIMSNPTWDSRYPAIISAIRWVNAIAPSSAGTPLANAVMNGSLFEAIMGWLMGYQSDAVRMQQTSWMAHYNDTWLLGTSGRPALPKGFWNIVGTDVQTWVTDSDSYCGGYALNVGLEVTQAWLSSCSDGFLDCSSQSAAGTTWFNDTSRTRGDSTIWLVTNDNSDGSEPLSHNQSRRGCFNLDTILRDDI